MSAEAEPRRAGGVGTALVWALASVLHAPDSAAGWQQRRGRRLRLGETDVGPQQPPTPDA